MLNGEYREGKSVDHERVHLLIVPLLRFMFLYLLSNAPNLGE